MFAQLTNSKDGNKVLVFFGTGGVIKAERFEDDSTTELYNAEGNLVATVKEDLSDISMKGVR